MNAPHRLQGYPPIDRFTIRRRLIVDESGKVTGLPEIDPAEIGRAFADGRAYRRFDGPPVHETIPNPDDSRTYREVVAVVAMLAALPWLALAVIWWLA